MRLQQLNFTFLSIILGLQAVVTQIQDGFTSTASNKEVGGGDNDEPQSYMLRECDGCPTNPGYKIIEIPANITANVALPDWLSSWEDASFMTRDGDFMGTPLLADSDDINVRAAAWVYSITSGHWITDESQVARVTKRDDVNYEEMILSYYKSGIVEEDESATRPREDE